MSLIALTSCGTSAPQPEPVEECSIVAVAGIDPYVFCKIGSKERRISIREANKFVCMPPKEHAKLKVYEKETLRPWIRANCK